MSTVSLNHELWLSVCQSTSAYTWFSVSVVYAVERESCQSTTAYTTEIDMQNCYVSHKICFTHEGMRVKCVDESRALVMSRQWCVRKCVHELLVNCVDESRALVMSRQLHTRPTAMHTSCLISHGTCSRTCSTLDRQTPLHSACQLCRWITSNSHESHHHWLITIRDSSPLTHHYSWLTTNCVDESLLTLLSSMNHYWLFSLHDS